MAALVLGIDIQPVGQKQVQQLPEPTQGGLRRASCALMGMRRGGEERGARLRSEGMRSATGGRGWGG